MFGKYKRLLSHLKMYNLGCKSDKKYCRFADFGQVKNNVQHLCNLQDAMHVTGHQVLPTQPLPGEAEDFLRGDNHPKHVPLLTYIAWL